MAEHRSEGVLGAPLAQVQKTFKRAQVGSERVVGRIRKQAEGLLGKDRTKAVDDFFAALQKRAEHVVKDLDARRQHLVAAIEKRAEKGAEPIIRGLRLNSHAEFEKLRKRVTALEKRVDDIASSKAA